MSNKILRYNLYFSSRAKCQKVEASRKTLTRIQRKYFVDYHRRFLGCPISRQSKFS